MLLEEIRIELALTVISGFLVLIMIALYVSFPTLFLKHPNQLQFYTMVFQLIEISLSISTSTLKLMYSIYRNKYTSQADYYINTSILLNFLMLYHYLLALNLEIIIKITKASVQGYKRRVILYHIISISMSLLMFILFLTMTEFKQELNANRDLETCLPITFCSGTYMPYH